MKVVDGECITWQASHNADVGIDGKGRDMGSRKGADGFSDSEPRAPGPERGVVTLVRELMGHIGRLSSLEQELARREQKGVALSLASGVALLVLGGILAFASLVVLLFGFGLLISFLLEAAGVPREHAAWLGPIVGGALGILGSGVSLYGGLAASGKIKKGFPKTSQTLKDTIAWIKSGLRRKEQTDA
ncbi:MAG: hypothetical protein GF344_19140 [Chitinivibrionales bacterium]|nr:hypothetical protein [Chitinivibrionales bacterium]MBD3358741.1 hypothetical protein [Chitinivibrionales bacterium]